jgi:hypothetical protein
LNEPNLFDAHMLLIVNVQQMEFSLSSASARLVKIPCITGAWSLLSLSFFKEGGGASVSSSEGPSSGLERQLECALTVLSNFSDEVFEYQSRLDRQLASNRRLINDPFFQNFDLGGRVNSAQFHANQKLRTVHRFLNEKRNEVLEAERVLIQMRSQEGVSEGSKLQPIIDDLMQRLPT